MLDDFVWKSKIELSKGLTREYMGELDFIKSKRT